MNQRKLEIAWQKMKSSLKDAAIIHQGGENLASPADGPDTWLLGKKAPDAGNCRLWAEGEILKAEANLLKAQAVSGFIDSVIEECGVSVTVDFSAPNATTCVLGNGLKFD